MYWRPTSRQHRILVERFCLPCTVEIMDPTIITYEVADTLMGRLSRQDVQRSLERATSEWNRVMTGLVHFVPRTRASCDPLVRVTVGHLYKGRERLAPGARDLATATEFKGKLNPRWIIELKDDAPPIDWVPAATNKWVRSCRNIFGLVPGKYSLVGVLLHELGHIMHLEHEEPEVLDLIMSSTCASRETISKFEAARYRDYFVRYILPDQAD